MADNDSSDRHNNKRRDRLLRKPYPVARRAVLRMASALSLALDDVTLQRLINDLINTDANPRLNDYEVQLLDHLCADLLDLNPDVKPLT